MQARADRMGATFTVTSRRGQGTTIEVDLSAAAIAAIQASAQLVDGHPRVLPTESASIRDV
jgi:hypothetical protein